PGEVLLQTHHPEHPLLQTLIAGGYHAFAAEELMQREAAGFPPFTHLALLRAEAKHADAPLQFLRAVKEMLDPFTRGAAGAGIRAGAGALSPLELHGPLPAPMPRRAGMHRAQLLLSAGSRRTLHGAMDAVASALYALPEARKVRWSLDVDPVDLY
ncbi:MAG: primosomal protein N', partial [Luteimonas sp.]|nr:primosomal protein N' [Luteimonas sp.]